MADDHQRVQDCEDDAVRLMKALRQKAEAEPAAMPQNDAEPQETQQDDAEPQETQQNDAEPQETPQDETEAKPKAASKRTTSKKTPSRHNKELGRRGEEAAARFLYRRGYEIVKRGWRCKFGEADIIARDEDTLVFIEVKTRSDCEKGFPAEAVTPTRRDRYEKIALAFLADYDEADIAVRFDVISIVVVAPDRAVIRHHINAFSMD